MRSQWAARFVAASQVALGSESANNTDVCYVLADALPGRIAFPNTTVYDGANEYWSNRQAETRPRCFVQPQSTSDVSITLKALTESQTPFTVKGGGHTAFGGASNLDGGITIDLQRLNALTIADDRKTVSVGPGNRWINVSEKLDPLGLAVVGGREWDVGVPGLVLGGGISYFSGQYGWACDNVRNFEVVLSSGEIVNASPSANSDLYWALRGGGGSNFGIVSRFDLVSFEQGKVWANDLIFPGSANHSMIRRFRALAVDGLARDPEAHTYMYTTYMPALGGYMVAGGFYHATPPSQTAAGWPIPDVFRPFHSQPGALVNSTKVANVSSLTRAIDDPYGSRQTWWDTTIGLGDGSEALLQDVVSMFSRLSDELRGRSGTAVTRAILVFQPISTNILQHMQRNGGNALGLSPSDGPMTIVQLSVTWKSDGMDALVESRAADFISSVEEMARAKHLLKGFVYMNYAGRTQQVQERYGEENYARLTEVARRWDPHANFQRLWKGYFKLGGHDRGGGGTREFL